MSLAEQPWVQVPDYVEPTIGWRVWDVIEVDGKLRLSSVAFRAIWLPKRKAVALCHRSLETLAWAGLPFHSAPHERCSCGIYAAQSGHQAAAYFSRPFMWRWSAIHRIVGTVSLWGNVVEGALGWRASNAYPSALYVPVPRRGFRSFLSGFPRPKLPVEEVALGLADYGVPVELVDCTSGRSLARLLEPGSTVRV